MQNTEPIRNSNHSVNQKWLGDCTRFIEQNLRDELRKIRGVFLPGDDFYVSGEPRDVLVHMASEILDWMNIKIKKDELVIDFCDDMEPPGLYTEIDGQKHILIKSAYKKDIFAMGAILAHELMHFYLLGKKKLSKKDELENELLTDLCTVKFGLGLIILNGMSYKNSWFTSILLLFVGFMYWSSEKLSFGYFNPKQYGKLVKKELKQKQITIQEYGGYIQPYARTFLGLKFWNFYGEKKSSKFIRSLIIKRFKWIIIKVLIVVLAGGTFGYKMYQDDIRNKQLLLEKVQIEKMEDYFEKNDAKIDALDKELYKMEDQLDKYKAEQNKKAFDALLAKYTVKYEEYKEYGKKYEKYEKMIDEYNAKIK